MAKTDPDGKPKKRSKLKLFFVFLFVLLILGGGAAGAGFFFLADRFKGDGEDADGGAATRQETAQTAAKHIGTTVALPAFTVNLADPLGQRFIKLSLEVELLNPKGAQDLDRQKARIRDSIIMLISSKSYADIATPESKIMLKSESCYNYVNQCLATCGNGRSSGLDFRF